jgi:hypothetical protein
MVVGGDSGKVLQPSVKGREVMPNLICKMAHRRWHSLRRGGQQRSGAIW